MVLIEEKTDQYAGLDHRQDELLSRIRLELTHRYFHSQRDLLLLHLQQICQLLRELARPACDL